MPRKYTKKNSEYWGGLSKAKVIEYAEPKLVGEASCFDTVDEGATKTRSNRIHKSPVKNRFANIDEGLLPFNYGNSSIDISEAVILCQKAYFNIAVFKSTIDLLAEFSNTTIYLEGGSAAAKKFIKAWFSKIDLPDLQDQYFREYYRSGNIFLYDLTGVLKDITVKIFELPIKAIGESIPIKYILLNPSDIVVNGQLSFGQFKYAKALTPYEIARLKNAKTEQEKEIYKSLTQEVKDKLNNYGSGINTAQQILLELDEKKFHAIFYKKQDYEPLSVPLGFPVLDDLNKKIELKKIDQAIARSVENVILLVTMGNEPDKGGINSNNLIAMQKIFENKSVGRVLVSDYTTSAEFIIPDLKRVLGKDKYETLNKDIEEGLGNILIGESKYSDTELKLKLFFARLQEGKKKFLEKFLQPEIDNLCQKFGFKKVPQAKFTEKDIINSSDLQKLITRMMELGILTPEQGMEVIHTGKFPEVDKMEEAQVEWKEQRLEGLYVPIVSSTVFYDPLNQQMADTSIDKPNKVVDPADNNTGRPSDRGGRGGDPQDNGYSGQRPGTYVDKTGKRKRYPLRRKSNTVSAPSGGRPTGTYTQSSLINVAEEIKNMFLRGEEHYRKKLGVNSLTEDQGKVLGQLCIKIVSCAKKKDWDKTLNGILNDKNEILKLEVLPEVLSIGATYHLDDYCAALLYHSNEN